MDVLTLCRDLFTQLNQKRVRYCHWKSNFHLKEALAGGITDLDLLVDSENFSCFQEIVEQLEFVELLSPPSKRFPGMSDYIGFDESTGKLVHLHVHKKLILGQRFIKNHHLPIESFVLDHCRNFDGIMIPDVEMELFILLIRAHMKLQFKDVLFFVSKMQKYPFPEAIVKEFHWLIGNADLERLEVLFQESTLPISFKVFKDFPERILNNNLTVRYLYKVRRAVFSNLKSYQWNDPSGRELTVFIESFKRFPVVRRFVDFPRKTLPGKGFFFAIVGADGSGKSTLVKDLEKWLSWKLEVHQLYFGIPKLKRLRLVNGVVQLIDKITVDKMIPFSAGLKKMAVNLADRRWLWIARYRYLTYLKARKARSVGGICIADRYPLPQFWSMQEPMDGPRIKDIPELNCKIAEKERTFYNNISLPDKIYVLQADIDVLRSRKNDLSEDCHRAKIDAVSGLKNNAGMQIIEVNQLYDKVLLSIKQDIWKQLYAVR